MEIRQSKLLKSLNTININMKNLKQKISIVAFLLLPISILSAQTPHKMSYQAVVRNSSFTLVVNSLIVTTAGTFLVNTNTIPQEHINGQP